MGYWCEKLLPILQNIVKGASQRNPIGFHQSNTCLWGANSSTRVLWMPPSPNEPLSSLALRGGSIPDQNVKHTEDIGEIMCFHEPIPFPASQKKKMKGWVSLCGVAICPLSLVWECAGVTRSPALPSISILRLTCSRLTFFFFPTLWQRIWLEIKLDKPQQVSKSCPFLITGTHCYKARHDNLFLDIFSTSKR